MLCCHTLVLRITTSISCSTCPNPSYVRHASSYSYLRHYIIFQSHIIPKVYCSSLFTVSPTSSHIPTRCLNHTVLCLYYLQPHSDALHIASTIESSVSPTSSHILASDTLRPPYYPLSLLHTATSLLLIHCPHCLSYIQPHHCSLYIAPTIQSSVSPTSNHILAPYTLPPPFSLLSLLPLATSWLLTHCLHHTVLCLSYH